MFSFSKGMSLSGADKPEAKEAILNGLKSKYATAAQHFHVCTDTFGGLFTMCPDGDFPPPISPPTRKHKLFFHQRKDDQKKRRRKKNARETLKTFFWYLRGRCADCRHGLQLPPGEHERHRGQLRRLGPLYGRRGLRYNHRHHATLKE